MPQADRLSAEAVKFLQEKQIAFLATIMRDGSPQVTPVWVDVEPDGSHILINTAEGRLKARNVARDARVAVSVMDGQNAVRFVSVRGTIEERRHEGAAEHLDFLARKYTGRDRYDYRGRVEQRVILRIQPHHVLERGL